MKSTPNFIMKNVKITHIIEINEKLGVPFQKNQHLFLFCGDGWQNLKLKLKLSMFYSLAIASKQAF